MKQQPNKCKTATVNFISTILCYKQGAITKVKNSVVGYRMGTPGTLPINIYAQVQPTKTMKTITITIIITILLSLLLLLLLSLIVLLIL